MSPHPAARAMLMTALFAAGCGPSRAATHSWQVTDFSRIRVEGPFDVRVHVGRPPSVHADGPQEAIDRLEVEQHGDLLLIHPARSQGWSAWGWSDKTPLTIDVGARAIAGATLAGSGKVVIDRVRGASLDLALAGSGALTVATAEVDQARLSVTGSGDLAIAGRARSATALVTGSGDLRAGGLAAGDATVTLAGSGDIALGASGNAAVRLSGSGDVSIVGPARCTIDRTGSGDVRCAHQVAPAD